MNKKERTGFKLLSCLGLFCVFAMGLMGLVACGGGGGGGGVVF